MKFHTSIFTVFLNILLWTFILTFLVPALVVLLVWKCTVILVAKLFYSNLHPTDPNDTYFAIDDVKGIPIVNASQIWRIRGKVCVAEFRAHFRKCFFSGKEEARTNYLNLQCYLVKFGGFVFKKSVEEVDLESQISVRTLDYGASLESTIVSWFVEEKYREDSPLWQIVLLYVPLTPNGEELETILLYKNHHCLADGYGFVHIIDKLCGQVSPYLVKEDQDDTLFNKIKDGFNFPAALTEYVLDVSSTPDIFYPIKNPDSRKWFLGLATLKLETIQEIRRKANTNFITVMMSVMVGALRRLLLERSCGGNEEQSQDLLDVDLECPYQRLTLPHPKPKSPSVVLPNSIYTANSLPWPNHPRNRLVNHWTGGVFKIPFETPDPLERLHGADSFFKHFHRIRMHRMVKRIIIPVTWVIPSFLLRLGHSLDLYYFRYSNTFASLMLSKEPYSLLGHKVTNLYLPLGLTDSVPTCVLFGVSTSHSGSLDLSLMANSEIVRSQSDVDRLTQVHFPMEVEDLRRRLAEANNNICVIDI